MRAISERTLSEGIFCIFSKILYVFPVYVSMIINFQHHIYVSTEIRFMVLEHKSTITVYFKTPSHCQSLELYTLQISNW